MVKLRLRWLDDTSSFRFKVGEVTIECRKNLPRWLLREDYFISGVGDIRPNDLPDFGFMIVRGRARSESDAARKLFHAAELFEAVVNLRWRSVALWTERKPEAVLWGGPHYFLFRGRKFQCEDHVYYNSHFNAEHWKRFPKRASEFRRPAPGVRRSLAALENHPFGTVIGKTMSLVSEGMVTHDLAFRLLRFWSALEMLFSRPVGTVRNNDLIDRATFHLSDPVLAKANLRKLSDMRNLYVHEGKSDGDDNDIIQFARELMCQHIFYVLHHGHDFRDHAKYLAMVDLPRDVADLAKKNLAIERRENIHRSGRHTSTITATADGRAATGVNPVTSDASRGAA